MLTDNDRIGDLGLFFLLSSALIEIGVFELPRALAQSVGRDSWLVIPLQLPVLLFAVYLFCALGIRFPRETLYEYGSRLMGKWVAQIVFAIVVVYWVLVAGRITRQFGDVVKLTLLDLTPLEVILTTVLIAAAHLARKGLEPIARCATIIFLGTWALGLAITVLTFFGTNPLANMLPVFANGPGPVLKRAVIELGSLEQIGLLLVLFPFLSVPRNALRTSWAAAATIAFTLEIVTLATLATFGPMELVHIRLPSLTVIQTIEQPLVFLERLSSFYVATWIAQVYITLSVMLWLLATSMQKWLGHRSNIGLVAPTLPVVYAIALAPANVTAVDTFAHALVTYGFVINLILPLLLYLTAVLRGVRGDSTATETPQQERET